MDWKKIEKDFYNDNYLEGFSSYSTKITEWFKNRIESDISVSNRIPTLTEEEKNEFYTTNITADIKPNYGK
jgi:hypothetical protein